VLLGTIARLVGVGARVIVVDNGSHDGTPAAVRERFPQVSVIALDRNIGAAARTVGARAAATPFVAFNDDDSWWAAGALEVAAQTLLDHARVGLVAARVLVGDDERLDPVSAQMGRSPLANTTGAPGSRVLGFAACGVVCRRDAFLRCPSSDFTRYGVGGEEALLALDLAADGFACIYRSDVVAHHHPARSTSPHATHRSRNRIAARNDLWTAWLRLGRRDAIAESARVLRRNGGLVGAFAATNGVPWVIRNRKPVPATVSRAFRDLGRG
jgi:GT2 family glycosyltransferase